MANDSLSKLREIFDGFHREEEQRFKALQTQTNAERLLLAELQQATAAEATRLDSLRKEVSAAERLLDQTKVEAATLRSRAAGEADRVLQEAVATRRKSMRPCALP